MGEQPSWWKKNEKLRDEMGLQSYEPPQFEDETYVHTVVTGLEEDRCCSIQFVAEDPTFPSIWAIEINGEQVQTLQRRKTGKGNIVYSITANEFIEIIEAHTAK